MAQLIADRRDVEFVLHEQLQLDYLTRHPEFEEFDKKTINLILSEARNLAIKEMLPTLKISDEEGCRLEKGEVKVPECYHKVYKLFTEGEWIAMYDDPKWGGQGMPMTLSLAVNSYFYGANFPFMMAIILVHGAAKLIEHYGTDAQKKLFLEKMYSGQWGGSMLLTESEAGSDVGALTTKAVKNEDGTYTITGNKIFISSGDSDLTENIIHPVLARIEGAPEGTAGISLFIVPKIWVNEDGSLGEPNDIVCTGLEEKMGLHGSPTCSMALGSKGLCKGVLLGQENKGMRAMFVMMNEARLDVGLQGLGCASTSFMNALTYARERIQGKNLLTTTKDAPSVPIIQHPDVRRMLLIMKSYTEGMRSLLYFIGFCEDCIHVSEDADEKSMYQGLIDFLIPIAKGYGTDKAFEICAHGVQIYGGYGYTKEYLQEQLLRDSKITQIYEGTNGIQAMDLLGRKLSLNKGEAVKGLIGKINEIIETAKGQNVLNDLAVEAEKTILKLEQTIEHVGPMVRSDKMLTAFSHAYSFMEVTGDIVMAWMLLWRATIAVEKLENGTKRKDTDFYTGQIRSAQFFIHSVLPVSRGKMDVILESDDAAILISENSFGGI